MSAPFVGRHRELGTLTGLVQRALRDGSPSAGLVSGEPGSGKTRLLAEAGRILTSDLVCTLGSERGFSFDTGRELVLTGFSGPILAFELSPREQGGAWG